MARCEEFRGRLADYLVGGLKARQRPRIEAHLQVCAECRAEMAALERTAAVVEGTALAEAPAGAWGAIRERIERPGSVVARGLRWAWGAAASAVVIALIVIALFVTRPGGGPTEVAMSPPAEEEMQVAIEARVPAAWAEPLSDEAAVGLRFASAENGG
ncbi:MAG: zf-HC2 domain-containing protein [Armatimonadota bacterium]